MVPNFQSAGGSGIVNVTTTDCCDWTASTTDNFITIINNANQGLKNVIVSIAKAAASFPHT